MLAPRFWGLLGSQGHDRWTAKGMGAGMAFQRKVREYGVRHTLMPAQDWDPEL